MQQYRFFSSFDKIIVYYDYGQVELAQILVSVFNTLFPNMEFRKIETNQYTLSQAADLICMGKYKGKVKNTQETASCFSKA